MTKAFRPFSPDQQLLLPPNLADWVPEGHLARFVADVVDALDLSAIHASYGGDGRGAPPYHPTMMVRLLVYGYCTGVCSSRRIERATYDDVAFRFLSADQHPDHASIAGFRARHLASLAALFLQVLQLCEKAGLVKLGHVSLDGTKVKANASKHKAMSYDRMTAKEKELVAKVEALLEEARRADEEDDATYGKGRRGDELPDELALKKSRLAKLAQAKAALEQEAKEKADREAAEAKAKNEERERKATETGKKTGGRPFAVPDPATAKPEPKAQKNFTDPESRIMLDGATKSFMQAYNAQIAVDGASQVIVATGVTQAATDNGQFLPMLAKVVENLGTLPGMVTADAGYYSEANLTAPQLDGVELLVPPNRREKGAAATAGPGVPKGPVAEAMREKLATPAGKALYALRKAIAEPVFGQIKGARGIRAFLFRGLEKVTHEWNLICATHNLLKLHRARLAHATAP